jgi:hypothetical protein
MVAQLRKDNGRTPMQIAPDLGTATPRPPRTAEVQQAVGGGGFAALMAEPPAEARPADVPDTAVQAGSAETDLGEEGVTTESPIDPDADAEGLAALMASGPPAGAPAPASGPRAPAPDLFPLPDGVRPEAPATRLAPPTLAPADPSTGRPAPDGAATPTAKAAAGHVDAAVATLPRAELDIEAADLRGTPATSGSEKPPSPATGPVGPGAGLRPSGRGDGAPTGDAMTAQMAEPKAARPDEGDPRAPSGDRTAPLHSASSGTPTPAAGLAVPPPGGTPEPAPAIILAEAEGRATDPTAPLSAAQAGSGTGSTPAASPAPPPATPASLAPQLAVAAHRLPDGPVELRLDPPELGRVTLTLVPAEAGLHVSVLAERGETLDLLRRSIGLLEQELRDLGYANTGFSFGEDRRTPERATTFAAPGGFDAGSAPDPTADPAPATHRPALAMAGLDLRL